MACPVAVSPWGWRAQKIRRRLHQLRGCLRHRRHCARAAIQQPMEQRNVSVFVARKRQLTFTTSLLEPETLWDGSEQPEHRVWKNHLRPYTIHTPQHRNRKPIAASCRFRTATCRGRSEGRRAAAAAAASFKFTRVDSRLNP